MSDENLAKAPGKILHVPTVAGADVVTYNLPGAPQLRLDGRSIADIFLGKITKWNDPRLARQNPAVALPDRTSWWCIGPMAAARPIFCAII